MIYRTPADQVKAYHDDLTAINQSSLKTILTQGMEKFLQEQEKGGLYYEEKEHFTIGSAVDSILTMGRDVFESTYHISALAKKPGDKCMAIVKQAFDIVSRDARLDDIAPIQNYAEAIWYACNENQYYMNRAKPNHEDDTRIGTLLKDNAAGYWDELLISSSKTLLSVDEANTIDLVVSSLLGHRHTAKLFQDAADRDIVYQFIVYFEYEGIICKAMMDKIIIDHARKRIMPIDIKTMGFAVSSFKQTMKARRYDLQGSFYHFALVMGITKLAKLIGKDLTGYTVTNFAFIAESTVSPGCPLVFPMTDRLMVHGRTGDGADYQGWQQALGIYKAWKQEGFSLERMVSKTNGVIFIDADFEYVYEKPI